MGSKTARQSSAELSLEKIEPLPSPSNLFLGRNLLFLLSFFAGVDKWSSSSMLLIFYFLENGVLMFLQKSGQKNLDVDNYETY
jgi:hypothetical protein